MSNDDLNYLLSLQQDLINKTFEINKIKKNLQNTLNNLNDHIYKKCNHKWKPDNNGSCGSSNYICTVCGLFK